MDARVFLETLLRANSRAIEAAFSDAEVASLATACQNYASDYDLLLSVIGNRLESTVMRAGIQEFQRSWYQAMIANYRSAFASLRLSAELLLSSVHFSTDEIKLRRWLKSQQDIIWSAVIDDQVGIYSTAFIGAFDENFIVDSTKYRSVASKIYRECSEFVHGNMITQSALSDDIKFDVIILKDWADKADSFRVSYLFAFADRYLCILDAQSRMRLEAILTQEFSNVLGVQAYYNI